MTGKSVQEPVALTEQFVRLVCSAVPAAWGWASSDSQHAHGGGGSGGDDQGYACGIDWLTADWLRDDAGKWWFTQVKAFKLTPAAEVTAARIRRVLAWAASHPVGLDRWLDSSGLGRKGPSKGGQEGVAHATEARYGAVGTGAVDSSSDSDGPVMPTEDDIRRVRSQQRGGAGGGTSRDGQLHSGEREHAVEQLNEEASKLLKAKRPGQESQTSRTMDTGGSAAVPGDESESDMSDDAMLSNSLAAAEVLVAGGRDMQLRTDAEQRRIALRSRSLLRSLGCPTLGDVPDDGQLHLAAAVGLKHVRRGGTLSSAVRALAVNSRQCHLCRLRFTPRETMPAYETYLAEAEALARQLVAEGGGVVPAQRVTYTGAVASDDTVEMPGGRDGGSSMLRGGSSGVGGGWSITSHDAAPTGHAGRRPASAFSRLQREGGEGGLNTTQLREAGMADAVGRLREGNEWRGQLDKLQAMHAQGGLWGGGSEGHLSRGTASRTDSGFGGGLRSQLLARQDRAARRTAAMRQAGGGVREGGGASSASNVRPASALPSTGAGDAHGARTAHLEGGSQVWEGAETSSVRWGDEGGGAQSDTPLHPLRNSQRHSSSPDRSMRSGHMKAADLMAVGSSALFGLHMQGAESTEYSTRGVLPRNLRQTKKLLEHIQSVDGLVAEVDDAMQAAAPLQSWDTKPKGGAGGSRRFHPSASTSHNVRGGSRTEHALSASASASSLRPSTADVRRSVAKRLAAARRTHGRAAAGLEGLSAEYEAATSTGHLNSNQAIESLLAQSAEHSTKLKLGLDPERAKRRAEAAARRAQAAHDAQMRKSGTLFGLSDAALATESKAGLGDDAVKGVQGGSQTVDMQRMPAFSFQLSKNMLSDVAVELQRRGWQSEWITHAVASAHMGSASAASGLRASGGGEGGGPTATVSATGVAESLNPSAAESGAHLFASTAYGKVWVCNLCYSVYSAQRRLHAVATQFAAAVGLQAAANSGPGGAAAIAVAAAHAKVPIRPLPSVLPQEQRQGGAGGGGSTPAPASQGVSNTTTQNWGRMSRNNTQNSDYSVPPSSVSGRGGVNPSWGGGGPQASSSVPGSDFHSDAGASRDTRGGGAYTVQSSGMDTGAISAGLHRKMHLRGQYGGNEEEEGGVPGFEGGGSHWSSNTADLVSNMGVQALGPLPASRQASVATGLSGLQRMGGGGGAAGGPSGAETGGVASAYEVMSIAARAAFDEAAAAAEQHVKRVQGGSAGALQDDPLSGAVRRGPSRLHADLLLGEQALQTPAASGAAVPAADPLVFDDRFSTAVQASFARSQGVGSLHRGVSPTKVKAGDVPWALVSAVVDTLSSNPTWVDVLLGKLPVLRSNAWLQGVADKGGEGGYSAAGLLEEYPSHRSRRQAVRAAIELRNLALLQPVTREAIVASLLNVALVTRKRGTDATSTVARRLAHLPANMPHVGQLVRVPVSDVKAAASGLLTGNASPSNTLHQYRVVFMFKRFQGLPGVTENKDLLRKFPPRHEDKGGAGGLQGQTDGAPSFVSSSIARQVRHLEWRYSVLNDEHRVPFKCKLPMAGTGTGNLASTAGIHALKVHYLVATPATMLRMLATQTVTLDLMAVFTRYVACDKVGKVVGVVRTVEEEGGEGGAEPMDQLAIDEDIREATAGTEADSVPAGSIDSFGSGGAGGMSANTEHQPLDGPGVGSFQQSPVHDDDDSGSQRSISHTPAQRAAIASIPLPVPRAQLVLASWARPHDVVRFEKRVFHERFEGKAAMHFQPFLSAGTGLSQAKHDFVVPVTSHRLGTLQLAVSVGVIRDAPPGQVSRPAQGREAVESLSASGPGTVGGGSNDTFSYYFTRGNGVLWPPEWFFDFRPLPRSWLGSLGGLQTQAGKVPHGGALTPATVPVSSTFTLRRRVGVAKGGAQSSPVSGRSKPPSHTSPAGSHSDLLSPAGTHLLDREQQDELETSAATGLQGELDLGDDFRGGAVPVPGGLLWGGGAWGPSSNGLPLAQLAQLVRTVIPAAELPEEVGGGEAGAGLRGVRSLHALELCLPAAAAWLQNTIAADPFRYSPGCGDAMPDFGTGDHTGDVLRSLFRAVCGGVDVSCAVGHSGNRDDTGVPGATGWWMPRMQEQGSGDGDGPALRLDVGAAPVPGAGMRPRRQQLQLAVPLLRMTTPHSEHSEAPPVPILQDEAHGWVCSGKDALTVARVATMASSMGMIATRTDDSEEGQSLTAPSKRSVFVPFPCFSCQVLEEAVPAWGSENTEDSNWREAALQSLNPPAPRSGTDTIPASFLVRYLWLREKAALRSVALNSRGTHATAFVAGLTRGGAAASGLRSGGGGLGSSLRGPATSLADGVALSFDSDGKVPEGSGDASQDGGGVLHEGLQTLPVQLVVPPSPQTTRERQQRHLWPGSLWGLLQTAVAKGAFKAGGAARVRGGMWRASARILESNWRPPLSTAITNALADAALVALEGGSRGGHLSRSTKSGLPPAARSPARSRPSAGAMGIGPRSTRNASAQNASGRSASADSKGGGGTVAERKESHFSMSPEQPALGGPSRSGTVASAFSAAGGGARRQQGGGGASIPADGSADRRMNWTELCIAVERFEIASLDSSVAAGRGGGASTSLDTTAQPGLGAGPPDAAAAEWAHHQPLLVVVGVDNCALLPPVLVSSAAIRSLSRRCGTPLYTPAFAPRHMDKRLASTDSRHRVIRRQALFRELFCCADPEQTGVADIAELRSALFHEAQLYMHDTRSRMQTHLEHDDYTQAEARDFVLQCMCSDLEIRRFMARWLLQDAALNGLLAAYQSDGAGGVNFIEWVALAECAFQCVNCRGHPLAGCVWGHSHSLGRPAPVAAADRYCMLSLQLQLHAEEHHMPTPAAGQEVSMGESSTVSVPLLPPPHIQPPSTSLSGRQSVSQLPQLNGRSIMQLPASFVCNVRPLHLDAQVLAPPHDRAAPARALARGMHEETGVARILSNHSVLYDASLQHVHTTHSAAGRQDSWAEGVQGGHADDATTSQDSDSDSLFQQQVLQAEQRATDSDSDSVKQEQGQEQGPGPCRPAAVRGARPRESRFSRAAAQRQHYARAGWGYSKAPPSPVRAAASKGRPTPRYDHTIESLQRAVPLPRGYVPSDVRVVQDGDVPLDAHDQLMRMLAQEGARQEGFGGEGGLDITPFHPRSQLLRPNSPLHAQQEYAQSSDVLSATSYSQGGGRGGVCKPRRRPQSAAPSSKHSAALHPIQGGEKTAGGGSRARLALGVRGGGASRHTTARPASAVPLPSRASGAVGGEDAPMDSSNRESVHASIYVRRGLQPGTAEGSAVSLPANTTKARRRRKPGMGGLSLRGVASAAGLDRIGGKKIRKAALRTGLEGGSDMGSVRSGAGGWASNAGSAWS